MSTAFTALGISPELSDLLQQDGINDPTPIQRQAIPLLLNGQDIIAQAQTGTGKTIAFALPILQRIDVNKNQVQALILTPTRELAIQITSELKKLAPAVDATVLAAYGGQDVEAQIRKLQNSPHIVVATPGRLIDHMKRETVNLGKLSMLVLDEADQMLHMGFLPEVESIITQTPRARQTMLFSATIPDAIRRLALDYMKTPADIRVRSANITLDSIQQLVIETTDRGKQKALVQLLEQHQPYLAVIFCRTKVRAKKLNAALQDLGFASDELHGDLTQAKREQVMKRFRDARLQVLVATDVAARGLDVEGVTHVYNYDVPQEGELYIHRIGRTGRAGHEGMAITLATPYDKSALLLIEQSINAKLDRRKMDHEGTIGMKRSPERERKDDARSGRGRSRGGKSANRGSGSSRSGSYGGDRFRSNSEGKSENTRRGGDRQSPAPPSGFGAGRRNSNENSEGNPWSVSHDESGSDRGSNRGRGGRSSARGTERSKLSTARRGTGLRNAGHGGRSGSPAKGGQSGNPVKGGRSGGSRGKTSRNTSTVSKPRGRSR